MGIFDGADFGNVPAWVGALVSSASIVTAATYYIADRRRADKAQARHVRFSAVSWGNGYFEVRVNNHSDKAIYDLGLHSERRSFRSYVQLLQESELVTVDDLPDLEEKWKMLPHARSYILDATSSQVKPGGSFESKYQGERTEGLSYFITFRDAMAQLWRLYLNGTNPYRVRDQPRRVYTRWDAIRYPRAIRGYRNLLKATDRWLKEHGY